MADIQEIGYRITALDQATAVFRTVEGGMDRLEKGYKRLTQITAIAVGMEFYRKMAEQTQEAEVANNRLNAALRATAAPEARRELDEYTEALSRSTQFTRENVLSAEANLLKFGNIHHEVFTDALKLSADYAALTGGDMTSATQAIGRALNSPTQGLKALQAELGKLPPQQVKHIEALMAQNKLVEAQAVVLGVLKSRLSGVAEEMNVGLLKQTSDVKKEWNELLQSLGKASIGDRENTFLGFVAMSFRDLKNIVEQGDWMDKAKNLLLFMAGARNMAVPGAPSAGGSRMSGGKIGGLPAGPATPEEPTAESIAAQRRANEIFQQLRAPGAGMKWQEARALANQSVGIAPGSGEEQRYNEMIKQRIKALQDEAAAWEAEDKDMMDRAGKTQDALVELARERVKVEENAATASGEAWGRYADAIEEGANARQRATAEYQQHMNEFMTETQVLYNEYRTAANGSSSAMAQLGFTASSAFEDMLIKGASVREMFQGLAQDILRIASRKLITDPLATSLTAGLNRMFGAPMVDTRANMEGADQFTGAGELQSALAAERAGLIPKYATGTPYVPRTGLALVHQGERITPSGLNDGGDGITINQNINVGGTVTPSDLANTREAAKQGAIEGITEAARRSPAMSRALSGR